MGPTVNQDSITFLDTLIPQHAGQSFNLVEKLAVSDGLPRLGYRAVIKDGCMMTVACQHMPINAVITR